MAKLRIAPGMIATVKGLINNHGLPYYQRAVPKALRARLGRATIKVPLERGALPIAIQCLRLQQRYDALFKAMREDPDLTPSDVKLAAIALLDTLGLAPGDGLIDDTYTRFDGFQETVNPAIDVLHDHLVDNDFTRSAVTDAAFKVLKNTLPVLLSEAIEIYLENHTKGKDKIFSDKQRSIWNKLILLIGDIALTSLNREHARKYRDHRLHQGLKKASVEREIAVLRAIVTRASRELSLNLQNPFESLVIPNDESESSGREPYTKEEIRLLVSKSLMKDDERRRIVCLLALTGARLAEIVGLKREDIDVAHRKIVIRPSAIRPLKTTSSARDVPLLPMAFQVVQRQLASHTNDLLFPTYASSGGANADGASAALNKWASTMVPNKTMHCFRHSMRDLLREVGCPESIAKDIGGWSKNRDVSESYGNGHPLEVKRAYLVKAYAWLEGSQQDRAE